MSDQTPPGWYADPQTGVQRWWDGSAWGQSAQVVQAIPVTPLNGNAAASFWVGLLSFVIFLLWPIALMMGVTAVVLGVIGYRSARRLRHRGTGYATWGVLLGGLSAFFGIAVLITTVTG